MRKNIFIIIVIFVSLSVQGQQDPHYTQYMYNMNIINPAYAGTQDGLVLSFLARTQWVGLKKSPRTLTLSAQAPVGKNVGLGVSLIADRIGPLSEENIYADFSYKIKIGDQTNLAFGLKAGATFLSAPLAFLNTVNSGDIAFQNNLNRVTPNFGFETYYYSDNYYLGFALPNLLKTVHFERKSGVISKAVEEIHYFFTGGYVFDMKNEIKFKPSFLVKAAVGAPISIDYSANILFQDNIEFGLSVRYDDSVSVIFSLNITEKLRMGYAYDHTLTNLGNYNSGSHEILMLFNFQPKESKSVRTF